MQVLRSTSVVFAVVSAGMALVELVYQGVANASPRIRTVEEMWSDISKPGFDSGHKIIQSLMPGMSNAIVHAPAPVPFAALAIVFYIAYRLMSFARGETKSTRL